jgi:hypothetical protein
MTPELKYSELTGRVYIVVGNKKTDVTDQFQRVLIMSMKPPHAESISQLVRSEKELKDMDGQTMFILTMERP